MIISIILLVNISFGASFSDISGHWAENYIKQATDKKYFSGYPDGTFLPQNSITRMEFIIICTKFINQHVEIKDKINIEKAYIFSDVKDITWALPLYKEFMTKVNIFGSRFDSDYGEKEIKQIFGEKFEPNKPITREEAVAIFNIFIDYSIKNSISIDEEMFNDTGAATFPKSINTAAKLKIVSGYTDGTFKPFGLITRAEASAMLLNFEKAKDSLLVIEEGIVYRAN